MLQNSIYRKKYVCLYDVGFVIEFVSVLIATFVVIRNLFVSFLREKKVSGFDCEFMAYGFGTFGSKLGLCQFVQWKSHSFRLSKVTKRILTNYFLLLTIALIHVIY